MVEPFRRHGTLSTQEPSRLTDTIPTTVTFVPARRVRSFDHIVGQIRDAIASGEIAPGERLPERARSRRGLRRLAHDAARGAARARGPGRDRDPHRLAGRRLRRRAELGARCRPHSARCCASARRPRASWPSSACRSRPRMPPGQHAARTRPRWPSSSTSSATWRARADDATRPVARGGRPRSALPRCRCPRNGQFGARGDHERDPRRAAARLHGRARCRRARRCAATSPASSTRSSTRSTQATPTRRARRCATTSRRWSRPGDRATPPVTPCAVAWATDRLPRCPRPTLKATAAEVCGRTGRAGSC